MTLERTYSAVLTCLCLCYALALSCNSPEPKQYSHPGYFDPVFKTAERMARVNADSALAYVDSAFSVFPDAGVTDLCRKYDYHVNYYLDLSRYNPAALLYADSIFWALGVHAQEPQFEKEYLNALVQKGHVLLARKEYADAFEYSYKARQVIERSHDNCMLSQYTYMLAGICYKQEKFLEAAHYDIEAIRESMSCEHNYKHFTTTQGRLNDIGFAFMQSGMTDSALYYYNRAIEYLDEHADSFSTIPGHALFIDVAKGVVYGNIGDVYLRKGDSVAAERNYRLDANIGDRPGYDPGDGQCTQLKIVSLYLAQKRLKEAEKELNILRASLDKHYWVDNEMKWLRLMISYLELTGHPERSYVYVKPYLALKDSLAAIKPVPQVDLVKGYEQIKDRYAMELLAHENKHKSYYLAIVLTSSLLAIIIALILWYAWKQSRRMNEAIVRRNNETVKRNNELKLALESLTESEQRNTRVMKIVAHDLRNPMASIISIASIILDNNNVNEEDREMLELMKTSGEHSLEMISNILNINSDAAVPVKAPTEIHELLRYSIDLMQFRAAEKGQKITLDTEEATLLVNKEKLWRVMSNLIVNAIKFSPEGSEIQITGRKRPGNFLMEIRDPGVGIPANMLDKIFDMFTDARRPGTSGEQSFGLGLAISRQLIEAHGGKLWCESVIGKGTSFFIQLPFLAQE